MLFKRKSGKNNTKSSITAPPDSNAPNSEERVPDAEYAHEEWDLGAHEEMSSLLDGGEDSEKLDDTRRAIAQRRASKKMASIDWDIAAREEITALLGNQVPDVNGNKGADNDLETVRRAIARRKAKDTTIPPVLSSPNRLENPSLDHSGSAPLEDEEDSGPRLDWLVDFISDGDSAPKSPNTPAIDNSVRSTSSTPSEENEVSSEKKNRSGKKAPPTKLESGTTQLEKQRKRKPRPKVRPDDIEVVPRKLQQSSPPFDPEVIVGDGYGDPKSFETSVDQSDSGGKNKAGTSLFESGESESEYPGGAEDNTSSDEAVESRGQRSNAQNSALRKNAAKAAPQKGKSLDLDSLRTKDRVVGLLLKKQVITMSQVYEAQKIKEREGLKETLWRILVEMNGVEKDAIYEEAARIYAFPVADVSGKLDAKFVRSVMETLSEENRDRLLNLHLVPFESESEQQSGGVKLVFITHDPMRTEVRRVMKELKLDRFDLYYAPKSAVESVITEAFPRKNEYLERMTEDPMAFDLGMSYEDADIIDEDALEAEISRSSLINLFEATLVEAVRQGASDVHIYPNAKKKVEIHFRVDGRLTLWHTEHKVHPEALLAVIKDNAMNVDRFERDAAQDGYIQRWIDDVLIRFRVSVLPIANISHEIRSESIVIRVLDDRKVIRDLRKLGLLDEAMAKFEQAISQPHGMVILTGPTGSGKSTTLVAALHQVITGEVNVLTVEDPVEYIIPGVRQIKLNYKLELENALRAILRHDPDVVMVGEMRDRKTAELAIKLANTGHLTFSTLHTNDAPSAISRLYKMGIEPFLIAYAINLIVAQRLIRLLCTNCKQPDLDPDPIMLEKLGFTREDISNKTFYVPGNDESCPVCKGIGYKGRRAVSEALYFSREVRHMIVEADKMIDEGAIKDQAVKEGMMTLRDSAREIVKLGQTSVREMIRVVTTES